MSAADWITGSDLPWERLVTLGPEPFRACARLRFLPDPTSAGEEEPILRDDAPDEYDLLRIALDVLAAHTDTPRDSYFCMWEGWGVPPTLQDSPRVTVPHRSYLLFRGALSDFADWDSPRMAGMPPGFAVPPPAFIWPADRTWCVALDVDSHYAGIGASSEAIARLVAHPALDTVVADPQEQQPSYM